MYPRRFQEMPSLVSDHQRSWMKLVCSVCISLMDCSCSVLVLSRIHFLEEQLREIEQRANDRLADEQRKHREVLVSHLRMCIGICNESLHINQGCSRIYPKSGQF